MTTCVLDSSFDPNLDVFSSVLCLEDKITTLSSCLVPKEVLGQGSQSPDQQACTPLLQYQ